ncbi:MAG TPA: hypothetical protein VF212_12615 [Longimicrobiales bacterium]
MRTIALLLAATLLPGALRAQTTAVPERFAELRFRSIGPAVAGGRIHDVESLPGDRGTVYVATASGGIWKTVNNGTTWTPLFDDQAVSTFGDLAIAPSDPDIVWAGTGEQNNRQSTSYGNGVYRSTDGGETWTHLGLEETRHIGRVIVHPEDPDIAYVAALGNLWKPSDARGVYRTTDGGESWEKVLFVDTLTGIVDLVMDPSDPNTLYAAAYQRQRRAWGFNGGGPGSGIYKTTDGGESWRELTNGIPAGDKGRIGLAISRTDPGVLMALIEHAEEGGTYRSEDGGESWSKVNDLNPRPMYYSHIFIDPTTDRRVYILGTDVYKSEDGGSTFEQLPYQPTYDVGVHSDFHTLWIDPEDPDHFYLAGDGGLHETWDRGETFTKHVNLPIGQFYAIGVDDREPYFIYGGMQDNHSWMGPSATRHWIGIINDDWRQIGFGDGMYQQPDRAGHRYVYTTPNNGRLTRLDAETGDLLEIRPHEAAGEAYRFDWVTPILASRHAPGTVYFGGNRLFISRDYGVSWERTEDLSRGIDRDTLRIMGVAGRDIRLSRNDGTSGFGEIVTIAESPLDPQVLWVGVDDGNLQVSRDGGESWTEVSGNVPGIPDGAYVSRVVASAAAPGRAYAAFDAHRRGDFRPYLFRTDDFGRSWRPAADGLPELGPVNVVVEHPANPDLLFAGTEHHLFVSTDAGASWARLGANLPTTLYDDLAIHPRTNDLVVATHGRSIWILDDVTPLVEWSPQVAAAPAHLFSIRSATAFHYWKDTSYRGQAAYAGENPPHGAIISYHLARTAADATLTITAADGRVVRRLDAPGSAGVIHRVVWDLRHEPPPIDDDDDAAGAALPVPPHPLTPRGPFVSPGSYTVTLEAGDARVSRTVEVRADPRLPHITLAQHREREAFLLDVLDLQRRTWDAAQQASRLRRELGQALERDDAKASPDLQRRHEEATSLAQRLNRLRREVYRLAAAFNGSGVRQGSMHPPTETHRQRLAELERQFEEEVGALADVRRP